MTVPNEDKLGEEIHLQIVRTLFRFKEVGLFPRDYFEEVKLGNYDIVTPEKAQAKSYHLEDPKGGELYTLKYFRCANCGRVYDIETHHQLSSKKCPACGGTLVQVPVHYPYKPRNADPISPPASRTRETAAIFSACGLQDPNSRCSLFKVEGHGLPVVKRILRLNAGRPLASMRWGCPFVKVSPDGHVEYEYYALDGQKVGFSKIKPRLHRITYKDGEKDVEYYPSNPLRCPFLKVKDGKYPLCTLDTSFGKFKKVENGVRLQVRPNYRYAPRTRLTFSLDIPMEPAFKNLVGDFHRAKEKESVTCDAFEPVVSKVYFSPKLEVYFFTFGTYFGHPDATKYARLFYVRETGGGRLEFWGRKLVTEGLLLEFDPVALSAAVKALKETSPEYERKDEFRVAEVVVHSVGHLLWKAVVLKTGLRYDEFGESIVLSDDGKYYFALYDAVDGGLDGVRSVLVEETDGTLFLDPDIARFCSDNKVCEAYCESGACKACLAIPNCHRGNYDLDWRILNAVLLKL